jgi:Domain of unknown function (DUF4185)
MGAAAYVGRVGGLAVALGVGSAIFAAQGVAWAEDSEVARTKPSTSATSDDDATGGDSTPDKPEKSTAEPDEAESEDTVEPPDQTAPGDEAAPEIEPDNATDDATEPAPETDRVVEDDDLVGKPSKSPGQSTPKESRTTKATPEVAAPEVVTDKSADQKVDDPAAAPKEPQKVAVFASATSLAESSPRTPSPSKTALLSTPADDPTLDKPSLITAVVNVVNSMLDWAHQSATAEPDDAPQPPFLWALLSFTRRELDNLFAARATGNSARDAAVTPTSLAMAEAATTAAVVPSYSPWPNPQVSPSTNFVSWLTGKTVYPGNLLLANTYNRFGVYGTDVGVMWDNGMVDNPSTPINEHQILIAVGDTFSDAAMSLGWRYNTLFRSSDTVLSDGLMIENGQWNNGNMFGGAPLGFAPVGYQNSRWARPIINRPNWAPNSVTLIPTAGISLPTKVTPDTPYGTIQYVSFMSVSQWGQAGSWTTNYSAIAYSTDNGENFKVAPESVRYNSFLSGDRNFQQSAFVKGNDGYVYVYGTPNGRQGAAYVARVTPENILNVAKYEYYQKASSGWFGSTKAGWVKGNPASASAVIGGQGGACEATKPGYAVSEMSVQYNAYLKKFIVLYGDESNNIVMRTADRPEGTWSDVKVLMPQQTGGIYAPMLHPWSPSTQGTGSDLYWNLSLWSQYNVMLMHTDLTKL